MAKHWLKYYIDCQKTLIIVRVKEQMFMKKRLTVLLAMLCLAMFLLPGMAWADGATSGSCGNNARWSFDASTGTLTISGKGAIEDYDCEWGRKLPPWVEYREDISQLVIKEGITSIGQDNFGSFWSIGAGYNISHISLPSTLKSIGYCAFANCPATSITIPEGVTAIGDYAFDGCGFNSITLPDTLKNIGEYAFKDCVDLTRVFIPNNVGSLGDGVFDGCISLNSIVVGSGNQYYASEDGFLMDKSKKHLIGLALAGIDEDCILPKTLECEIDLFYFWGRPFKSITVPESVAITCGVTPPDSLLGSEDKSKCITLYCEGDVPDTSSFYFWDGENLIDIKAVKVGNKPTTPAVTKILSQTPRDGFAVQVLDENGAPVSGATVTAENSSTGTSFVTDQDGVVIFTVYPITTQKNITQNLKITKDGYQTLSVKRRVNLGGMTAVTIFKDDGRVHISSVDGTIKGETKDLLSDYFYFKANSGNAQEAANQSNVEEFTINIAASSAKTISKYQLIQDSKVIFESSSTLVIPVLTGPANDPNGFGTAWRITKLKAGQPVYLRVIDENGVASKQVKLALKISEPITYGEVLPDRDKGKVSFGKKIEINVPEDIPIFGGAELECGIDELPFQFQVFEEGKVRFAINPSKDLLSGAQIDGADLANWDEVRKDYNAALKDVTLGRAATSKKFGGQPQSFSASNFKVDANILGYGEGYVDDYGNIYVDVGLVISFQQKYTLTQQTFIMYIPVYVSLDEEAKASGSGSLTIDFAGGKVHLTGSNVETDLSVSLNPAAGIGVDGVLNAEFGGKGELSWLSRWKDDYNKVDLNGNLYIAGEVFWMRKEWPLLDGTWTIYESSGKRSGNYRMANSGNFYGSDGFVPTSRDYLNRPMMFAAGRDVVKDNVYSNAAPTLVQVGDTAYLFWLEDLPSRSDNNRTALVYAVSTDMVSWSAPVQVISETPESTADLMYDVCVQGKTIHIALSKANRQFSDDTELGMDELAASADIYYTSLDTETGDVAPLQCLVSNNYANIVPKVAVNNGQVTIAYLENHMENGLFGTDNTWRVGSVPASGGEASYIETDGLTNALNIGVLDGKTAIAYIVDADRDYSTVDDTELWLVVDGEVTQFTDNQVADVSPTFAKVGADDVLMWYSGGNICYVNAVDGAATEILAEDNIAAVNSGFYVVNDESGNAKVVWETLPAGDDVDTITAYAAAYDNGSWSAAYPLLETDSLLTSPLSGYTVGDKDYIAYLRTMELYEDGQLTALCVTAAEPSTDIALLGVDYDLADVVPGDNLPLTLTVKNNGGTLIDSFSVTVGGEEMTAINNAALEIGETKVFTVSDYTVPATLTGLQTVAAEVNTDADINSGNNSCELSIGYTDVAVSATRLLVNGSDWASIAIVNESAMPTDVKLQVLADSQDGAVLFEQTFNDISAENAQAVMLDMNTLANKNDIHVLYAVVAPTNEELITNNNSDLIYLNGTVTEDAPSQGSSHSSSSRKNSVNIADVTGGDVNITPKNPTKGDKVTITVTPNEGYKLSELTVSDNTGKTLDVTNVSATEYTFVMPDGKVDIIAKFVQVEANHRFTDVPVDAWYAEAVNYVDGNGLMMGESDTLFNPDGALNRAMLVTILYRMEKEPDVTAANPYTDVAADTWYSDAVIWATENNIVKGYGAGIFAPLQVITREEIAAVFMRYAEFKNMDVSDRADLSKYADADLISDWAVANMQWSNAQKLIQGDEQNCLKPQGEATRAEAAMILMRFCENIMK